MAFHTPKIVAADVTWRDATQPQSIRYADHYYANEGGYEESQYVFLRHNHLPDAWRGKDHFIIAETGFGTGLNFLAASRLWLETTASPARLHFVSVEKHPMRRHELERALSAWPSLTELTKSFLAHYPQFFVERYFRHEYFNNRVVLTLCFGDVHDVLPELDFVADAWFLDGFAPARNPEMWTPQLFSEMARLSQRGTTFSTFTAAGLVKRGLRDSGFEVEKFKGFGQKREMLRGTFQGSNETTRRAPWFSYKTSRNAIKTASVIGAGIAGSAVAHALARRGWDVTVYDQHPHAAGHGSGNLSGVVMPLLSADYSRDARFYTHAFLHSVGVFDELKAGNVRFSWTKSGVLQLIESERIEKVKRLELPHEYVSIVNQSEASELCGADVASGGLCFPDGGYLQPVDVCNFLLSNDEKILTHFGQKISRLKFRGGRWQLLGEDGHIVGDDANVILANADQVAELISVPEAKFQTTRGQLCYFDETLQAQELRLPVCYKGYVIPAVNGLCCVGASYDIDDGTTALRAQTQNELLDALAQAVPGLKKVNASVKGRVAFRTTCADHLPLVGPVPDEKVFRDVYADLRHGKRANLYPHAQYQPGLFVSAGHGSRGFTTALFAAELIADMLEGAPRIAPSGIGDMLHPARFLVRALKKLLPKD